MKLFKVILAAFMLVGVSAQSQAGEKTDVEIGYMPILPVSQLFVGLEEGWLEEAGINPSLVQFQNGPAMVQAVLAGQLDVAYFGIGPAMVARAKGADIKVVASNIVEQISIVTLGELAPYFDGDHKTAFKRFSEDKGRKPVITTFPEGSVPQTVLQYWLRKQLQIDPDQVEVIYQGAAQVQQALLTGAVDGAAILEPVVSIVGAKVDDAKVVAAGAELFPNQPGAVLAVREGLIEKHPELVQKLVKAHAEATDMLSQNADQAAVHVGKYVGGGRLDPKIIVKAVQSSGNNFVADPNFIFDATKVMHDFQAELGTLKKPVDLGTLFDLTFYNKLER